MGDLEETDITYLLHINKLTNTITLSKLSLMDLFNKAKVVTLRSHHDKYLVADADQQTVRQSHNGNSRKARWRVELVENKPHVVRLKSCHGLYLTATDLPFLLGMTGQKVLQTDGAADNISDSKIEWEPIRVDGCQMKLRTWSGMHLRANSWLPPWRNSVTHDEPFRSSTQDWVLWLVGVVEVEALSTELVPTDSLLSQQSSVSSSFSDELNGSENGSPMSSGKDNVMQLINISDLSLKTDSLILHNADQEQDPKEKAAKNDAKQEQDSKGPEMVKYVTEMLAQKVNKTLCDLKHKTGVL